MVLCEDVNGRNPGINELREIPINYRVEERRNHKRVRNSRYQTVRDEGKTLFDGKNPKPLNTETRHVDVRDLWRDVKSLVNPSPTPIKGRVAKVYRKRQSNV